MQEQELFDAYNKRLKLYQKKFNRDRMFPFTEIKIKEGGEKGISTEIFFDMFIYDTILIPSKHLEIFNEIIDFAAILSFLPVEFRLEYLSKLVFLLHFKNSEKSQIKYLWNEMNKYVSQMMIKLVLNDTPLYFYLNDITINNLFFEFTVRINPPYKEVVFFAIFIYWLRVEYSKKFNIGTMRDIMTYLSDLSSFNDFLMATTEINEKYLISTSLLVRNYSMIGLNHFFVWINFCNNKKSQKNLEKFFFKVPFFSHFFYINSTCQFSCFIPISFKTIIQNYLKRLQELKIIDVFHIDFIVETNFIVEFETTIARDQKVYELIPYTSKKFEQNKFLPPNLKKLPKFALVNHSQTYPKSILKLNSTIDALDFYIFFNIGNLLNKKESIHNLIERNLLISSILNMNSKQIKKTYDIFFSDNLIQGKKKTPTKEFEKLIREKYPRKKSIEFLISMFRELKIPDTSFLTKNFFEKHMLRIGNEFNRYFFKKSDHSMFELKKRSRHLIEKGFLKNHFDFSIFITSPNIIILRIISKSTLELINCMLARDIWICKKSIDYGVYLTTNTYLLFSKYLLKNALISIGIVYILESSVIDFNVVSFFDFEKRDWDEKKSDKYLKSLLNETQFEKKKKTHQKVTLDHWQEKLPLFQFSDFFRDLRYFNNLNEISKKSCINREKVIAFFKNYIQNQQYNFSYITDKIDFGMEIAIYPTLEKKKRIFILISQPGTNINPFILKKTRAFSILFSDYIQNGWYYGGSMDNILILEYLVKNEILKNKDSDWNKGIKAIKTRYPNLNLKIFELKEDMRFFNEQSLYSYSWYYDDFNYLKQTSDLEFDDLEVKNEFSFIFESKFNCKEYHPNFLPWKFWQIIGYPVSACILVDGSEEESKLVIKIIKRLPVGQIFKFKKDGSSKIITLLVLVQLKNNIDRFFENLILALKNFNCKYYLSLIIPLSLYGEEFIRKKMKNG